MRYSHDAPSWDEMLDERSTVFVQLRLLAHLEPELVGSARKPSLSDYDGNVEE